MTLRHIIGFIATALLLVIALAIGHRLWVHYMDEPWTRDGRVRAQIVNIAPDVSGAIVDLPVADNMFVKKGQVLMRIDPAHYQVAVEQAEAAVAARRAEWQMRRADAARRADMDSLVVSKENRENASSAATAC
jgi:multidrug resistance efflux pump